MRTRHAVGGIGLSLALCLPAFALGVARQSEAQSAPEDKAKIAAASRPSINDVVVSYVAAWNERDPKRRKELIAKTWTESGTYVDANRHGAGYDGIDAMIDTVQKRFPGYRLGLVSGIETHNGRVRFSWAAGGTLEAPLYLAGTDFGVVAEDGRFLAVTGFVDAAPAPAR